MTLLDIKRIILDHIKTLPVCIPNSAQTNWVTRCPYCNDSRNRLHGHFSIKIDTNSDSIIVFRCFRCNESGILTSQVMEDIGAPLSIEDAKALDALNRPSNKSTYARQRPLNYKVPVIINPIDNKIKLDYLNNRLGIEFTSEMIQESKIILSIMDFFTENKIKIPDHINPRLIKLIEENYIGFLSANNNKITFRRIIDNDQLNRYIKLLIDPYNTSPNNFYSLKNPGIDLLYNHPIHVHVAEGTFDILSIKYNLIHDPSQMHLFFASCGYNFGTIIKWLIYMGINTDLYIHLYSDNDKSDKDDIKILNSGINQYWIDHAYIHRNMYPDEKDFGVPANRIKESYIQVK